MTGYTVHTGTSEKYAAGWDSIFGKAPKKAAKVRKAPKKAVKKKKAGR